MFVVVGGVCGIPLFPFPSASPLFAIFLSSSSHFSSSYDDGS